jgi:hypothetical protein
MLLVLDEAQVLAESAHTDLAHSLRASLDARKQNIKVIFAGSSEATLRRMFGRSTEPFYNWAPLEPFFRRYLSRSLAYADRGSKAALLDTEAHVFNDANVVTTWHRLLPADHELLRLIVSGVTDLFSESSRGRLGAALGLDEAVAKNVRQQLLRRLQDADLVLRMDYGDYRMQDDALAEWLRNQELED